METFRRKTILSRSPEATLRYARQFARNLKPGDVVGLEGSLGSGKTTFVRGLAEGLGLSNPGMVKSPTFVIMHSYPSKIPLYHFDLYRLDCQEDLEVIGFDEFLNDPRAVVCVEWAEKGKGFLPAHSYRIRFEVAGSRTRRIRFERVRARKKRQGGAS